MAASMKDIKLRIHSVESTMQITRAMELVAASKLRRAQERMEQSRPYFRALRDTLRDIAANDPYIESPYFERRETKRACYVVIAGDRGLAGGYNNNVLRHAAGCIGGQDAAVLPIGRKALEYFRGRGAALWSEAYEYAADVTVGECFSVARLLCESYRKGEFDEVHLVYTHFVSVLSQVPEEVRMLPLYADLGGKKSDKRRPLTLYEPSAGAVFDRIVPEYLGGLIYGALCESVVSEQGARRTAMDAATSNAEEMIDELTLRYNRARQGAITQELTEIVAGAQE